ncbi:MAG TPA: ankyrin repeat domain-containing protein [Pararobbsia sp.]|nr:ankyrin repeat domain-containing protein [Pararobbsia sp.]
MTRINFQKDFKWVKDKPVTADEASSHSNERVYYNKFKDGDLVAFDRSDKGHVLRAQYRTDIGTLRNYLQKRGPAVSGQETALSNLETFGNKIGQGVDGPYSTALHALYGGGKKALDNIAARVDRESPCATAAATQADTDGSAIANVATPTGIGAESQADITVPSGNADAPAAKLKVDIVEMALGLGVCGPGVASHLMMTDQRMNADSAGIGGHAQQLWDTVVDNAIRQFVQSTHGKEDNYRGEEIHLVNAYRNRLASRLFVTQRPDDFVPPHAGADGKFEQCQAFVGTRATPAKLLHLMAEECLQTVHDQFAKYRDRPLDEAEVWQLRQEYEESLSASMAMKYGEIGPDVLVNEHHGENAVHAGQEGGEYRLIDNPTLLMRTLSKNLFKAGIFDSSYKPTRVFGEKGAEHVVKQIGDADIFYTRTGRDEMAEYRPLRADGLAELVGKLRPRDATPSMLAAMTRSAFANTGAPQLLAKIPPEHIWDTLIQSPNRIEMIERFSHPDVRRYRQADAGNATILLRRMMRQLRELPALYAEQALILSAKVGDSELGCSIAEILKSVNEVDLSGRTALHIAAGSGDSRLAAAIVPRMSKLKIGQRDRLGLTPLMIAAEHGHVGVIDCLATAKASVDQPGPDGMTALIIAVEHGHVGAVEQLIRWKANVNIQDKRGYTPLILAAHGGHTDLIDALIKANAFVDTRTFSGESPLMVAVQADHIDAIKRFIEANADVNVGDNYGTTPLMWAAQNGNAEAISLLIASNANLNKQTSGTRDTALTIATTNGHVEAIKRLVEAGADVNMADSHKWTALMTAAEQGHLEVIDLLIRAKASVDDQDVDGNTALMWAAQAGHVKVIARLIDAKANFELRRPDGCTAFDLAMQHRHPAAMLALVGARGTR